MKITKDKFLILAIISFLSLSKTSEGKTAQGWVPTRGSMYCISQSTSRIPILNSCFKSQVKYLTKKIEKKLRPNNPEGKYDLLWWNHKQKEIKEKCIKEAIIYQKEYKNLMYGDYDLADFNACLSNIYSDLNRSLVRDDLPIKP
jgi:hypothetical protein